MDRFDYGAIMSLLFVAFMVGVWFGTPQMVKADILIKGLNDHNGVLSIVNGSSHAVVHGHKIVSILLPNANPDNGTQTDVQQPLTIQSQQHIPSAADASLSVSVPTQCQMNGTALPDSQCTPGDTNSDVTQNTIGSTICVHGWTATIRPPVSFTDPLKLQLMQSYGFGNDTPHNYELDHLIPLELGGNPTAVANLWPEPGYTQPNFHNKDHFENYLKAQVCAGNIPLDVAQHEIAADWIDNWNAAGQP